MIWEINGQNTPYFFDLLRKYIIVFGKVFDNISIERTIANNATQEITVPLTYAPKDKMIVRLNDDPDLDRPYSALLPRMSFEIFPPGLIYDRDRKLSSTGKNVQRNPSNKNNFNVLYNPVPYDLKMNLYVYVKNQLDGTKIIETILPFFTPDFTPEVQLIPSMKETRNVPIILDGVSLQDIYDDKFQNRRVMLWTLSFTMKVVLFGPVIPTPMIKFIQMNQYAGFPNEPIGVGVPLGQYVNSTSNTINLSWTGNTATTGIPSSNGYYGQIDQEIVYVVGGAGSNTLIVQRGASNTASNFHFAGSTFNVLNTPLTNEYVIVQPTEAANGQAVNSIAASISWTLIDVADDYGFGEAIESGTVP